MGRQVRGCGERQEDGERGKRMGERQEDGDRGKRMGREPRGLGDRQEDRKKARRMGRETFWDHLHPFMECNIQDDNYMLLLDQLERF